MVSLKLLLKNMFQLRRFPKCTVKMGKHNMGTPYMAYSSKKDRVITGNYCTFSRGSILIAGTGHIPPKAYSDHWVSTYPLQVIKKHGWRDKYNLPQKKNYVIIGNDVWLGVNSVVLYGVTVGDGAVIGAGAVVTQDVPPYAIVAGAPAKILRYRYSQQQIKKLLRIAWWNWSEQKIYDNMDYFFGDVDTFIKNFSDEKELSK